MTRKKDEELDTNVDPAITEAADISTEDAGSTPAETGDPIVIGLDPAPDGSAPNDGVATDPNEVMRNERLHLENRTGAFTDAGEIDQDAAIEQQAKVESGELPSWEGTITHEAVNMVLVYPDYLMREIQWAKENSSPYALLRIRENLLAAAAVCL